MWEVSLETWMSGRDLSSGILPYSIYPVKINLFCLQKKLKFFIRRIQMKKLIFLILIILVIAVLLVIGKKSITTEIIINSPVDKVWEEFTDFSKYPDWNPFIKKIAGDFKTGSRIEVEFHTQGHKPMVFTPDILVMQKNSIFQWEGKLLMPGIFTGRHTFQLVEIEKNKTKLIQKEDFNGILVPFFSFDSTLDGFQSMNKALKERIEQKNKVN
jgi:hypothetical protein